MKTIPRYNGAYPLAAELVLAARLEKQARIFTGAVHRACIATYRAVARSSFNVDAADGKDISVAHAAGGELSTAQVKRVRKYLKKKFGSNWSHLTREKQTQVINAFISQTLDITPVKAAAVAGLVSYGEYGAVPAHIIAGVQQAIASNIVKGFATSELGGIAQASESIAAITAQASAVRAQIEAADFGLTPEHWKGHYQKFTVDAAPLVDILTGATVPASAAGAVAPEVPALISQVVEIAAVTSAPALDAVKKDALTNAAQDFQLIIKAAEGQRLAEGVTLTPDELENLIGVDVFENDLELSKATDKWVEENFARIKNMEADALKRGISVTQQAIKDGRSEPWLQEQLVRQMDISAGRAKIIARNATGNASWIASYAGAKTGGMRYYRWRGMLDERERHEHVIREGKAYDPMHPPTDGNPGQPICCRCLPEWLFDDSEVEDAENEITARHRN